MWNSIVSVLDHCPFYLMLVYIFRMLFYMFRYLDFMSLRVIILHHFEPSLSGGWCENGRSPRKSKAPTDCGFSRSWAEAVRDEIINVRASNHSGNEQCMRKAINQTSIFINQRTGRSSMLPFLFPFFLIY